MKTALKCHRSPLLFLLCLVLLTAAHNIGKKEDMESKSIEWNIGQSVILNCPPVNVSAFSVIWTVNGGNQILGQHPRYKDRVKFLMLKLGVIIFNLTEEDSGVYCCKVENISGQSHHKIQLIVPQQVQQPHSTDSAGIDIHTIVEQPPFIIAETEGSVTIECKVSSLSSSFSVFWTLGCEERRPVGKESRVTYESLNRVITISNLTELDSGIYCCLAETVDGKLVRGNGTRLGVTKTSCSAEPCHCEKGALLLTMEILRVIALIILIILLIIVIRSSC